MKLLKRTIVEEYLPDFDLNGEFVKCQNLIISLEHEAYPTVVNPSDLGLHNFKVKANSLSFSILNMLN